MAKRFEKKNYLGEQVALQYGIKKDLSREEKMSAIKQAIPTSLKSRKDATSVFKIWGIRDGKAVFHLPNERWSVFLTHKSKEVKGSYNMGAGNGNILVSVGDIVMVEPAGDFQWGRFYSNFIITGLNDKVMWGKRLHPLEALKRTS